MSKELDGLREVDFGWVRSLDSIWADAEVVSLGPNHVLAEGVAANFLKRTKDSSAKPNGQVLVGQSGIGKTHLVGELRRKVWRSGGWFVLLDVLGLTDFWRNAALSFLTSLLQEMPDGRRQLEAVLSGVARLLRVEEQAEAAFNTPDIDSRKIVDVLVKGLMKVDLQRTLSHQDVFRALCLLRSTDLSTISLGHSWLQGYDADPQARAALGFHAPPPAPVELVRGMSWLMSLSGPTLVAVDQIDGVVNPSSVTGAGSGDIDGPEPLSSVLAAGLLQLHDVRSRGMTVITCLYDSWKVLADRGLMPFRQRFDEPIAMQGFNDRSAVRALVESRLTPSYDATGLAPQFSTFPFSEIAIESAAAAGMTPRTILMRCDAFRRACIDAGAVEICNSLVAKVQVDPPQPTESEFDLTRGRQTAEIYGLIKPKDDSDFGRLLRDVLHLYARQFEPDEAIDVESRGDPAQKVPPLHGRVTFIHHDQNDREQHFCFRALEHSHAISFQARLRAALTASGISTRIPDRHLVLVRRSPVPSGTKTQQLFEAFQRAGGVTIAPSDEDLRTFVALRTLCDEADGAGQHAEFDRWLRRDKPLNETAFFKQAGLGPAPTTLGVSPEPHQKEAEPTGAGPEFPVGEAPQEPAPIASGAGAGTKSSPADRATARPEPPPAPIQVNAIPVGRRMAVGDEPVTLPTSLLPRHTVIIAGSGSGKTVLLRRIVEEAALAGIPAIVLDPNNDLSRLGDRWPEVPEGFTPEDETKARHFHDNVDVVVWTPGIHAGNPLFLSVLPDFASLGPDKDERQQAVDMAAETLGPLAGAKNALQRGVLVEALRHFASRGGGQLAEFTALLADLPEGLSPIGNATKLAAGMADQLYAAVATNPLLKGEGPLLDPKVLFYGPDPSRVRLSIINLSGLPSDAAREDLVNRLQMTLFGWIKKHPSPTGLLYVLDEAQTFVPAQKPALSLGSGIKLVAQARKYGLGMILATQAPRGIHNQVVSNCTTQFFGKQSAPATIAAAQEIIAASGGKADDLGKLKAGEFYFRTEGWTKPAKVRTPICLSYHPPNPPTPEDVIARAHRSRVQQTASAS